MKTVVTQVEREVEVPQGVQVSLEGGIVTVKGPGGELKKRMGYPGITIRVEEDKVTISADYPRKTQKAIVGTYASHIRNMIKGVTEGYEYRLKAVYAHFPMSIKVEGNRVRVDNFLGEKTPRSTKIVGRCEVTVKGTELVVKGIDKEEVGQTVANIEKLTRVRKRDPRVFQDGIYLIERDGVPV
jgi:large subunit ribosomal protein L6